jgi:hypothetical protein
MIVKMKKYILLFITALIAISCSDVLDKQNLSAIDDSYVWTDPNMIELNVNSFYGNWMPVGLFNKQRIYDLGIISDEARSGYNGRAVNWINGVRFAADRTDVPCQSWNYGGVRKANEFLQNIDERYVLSANASQADIDKRNRFIGEVRFYRAHMYWDMMKVYGGVPIVTKVLDQYEKDSTLLYPKRNTSDECFDYVIKELKDAAELLPITYSGDNWGRITKGAALAYCARIQLFRASPMFNPDNNIQLWKDAYQTYKDVIALGIYDLNPIFSNIWKEKGPTNKEIIWFRDYAKGVDTHGWDSANMMHSQAVGDATANCPIQELVDAFPMKDGTPYVKPATETAPYINRDPRLRETVVWNGDTYGPRKDTIYTFVSESTNTQSPLYNFDGIDSNQSATSTGYYMRKMKDESLDGTKGDYGYGFGSYTQWVEIRYAEVLLGLAEAANEIGETEEGVEQIIKLRKRAGIMAGTNNRYGIPENISQSAFRTLVQNERYIELAFENKRYWDLRRWKLAVSKLSVQLHAMEIRKKISATGVISYTYTRRLQRHDKTNKPVFLEKFYFLPLPKGELLKNPNLEQNEAWK